jgi:hypothetical protein
MVLRPLRRLDLICRGMMLASLLVTSVSCVAVDEGSAIAALNRRPDDPIGLPEAEHKIDDLDRMMTAFGTISIKTPDVWGQDRLAKFRSEYEAQMSSWLKQSFKSDINAAVRHSESEATRISVGMNVADPLPKPSTATTTTTTTTPPPESVNLESMIKAQAALNPTSNVWTTPPEKTSVALEPTVVLDEHSNYLNHLNQLRRINAGDDLTDRPGYGLYLIRIPVTLSPGPRSRRGKGAIITVSAKSVMTKHTLRDALRNAVINETVTDLTQAITNRSGSSGDQDPLRGAGSFSLLSFADTELYHGAENIALLRGEAERHLAGELGDEPHHRSARVAEWLRGELQSSYHLLEEAATPANTADVASRVDPLEELGDSILKRDFPRIAQFQPGKGRDSLVLRTATGKSSVDLVSIEQRRRVVEILSFALRIQAAGVNRRLKQDMADQDSELSPDVLKRISFFEPEPSDLAMQAFQKYVDMKWPLRVYAIEPVIAQQNVADAFSRRKFSAIDLVGSSYGGPLRGLTGIEAQRQAADDETAIRLNPTMVGFGAGQNTFGWIFYPRLQTNGGKRGRIITDIALLATGRVPDPTGSDQSIEPGQRECTALVEMPNFVPKIEFISVANWFRTSEVGDGQKSDLEKSAVLGRKLVLADEALNRAQVEGHYRPEELQIATERLKQLRSLMPTHRMVVRVPFADNQNDARIFCSHGSQLRPTLTGWHGKPPEEGQETTLFLEGMNFSIHDTHVIAGGKHVSAVLVSRQLLEVTIPKDACPTPNAQGTSLLDINVATPNGVSNHLLIKMQPPDGHRRQVLVERDSKVVSEVKVVTAVDSGRATGPGKPNAPRAKPEPMPFGAIPVP